MTRLTVSQFLAAVALVLLGLAIAACAAYLGGF
jgi:hypothetical protein